MKKAFIMETPSPRFTFNRLDARSRLLHSLWRGRETVEMDALKAFPCQKNACKLVHGWRDRQRCALSVRESRLRKKRWAKNVDG